MSAKILAFPAEIIIQQRLRMMQEWVNRLNNTIETCTGTDLDSQLRVISAEAVLPIAQEDLRKAEAAAEMLTADDTMKHKGMVYRAHASTAGAN